MSLKQAELPVVKYIGKVYKMGDNKMVVSIPRKKWDEAESLIGKDVLVILQEAIQE